MCYSYAVDIFYRLIAAFWQLFLLSAPYLFLGLGIAVLIQRLLPLDFIQKKMGKNQWSDVFYGALLGVPLPLCSCSVIPGALTLYRKGASKAGVSSFLIATPESGIDSLAVTYALMDFPMTIFRPLFAFLSALGAGGAQLLFNTQNQEKVHESEVKSCCAQKKESTSGWRKALGYVFTDLLGDISGGLLLGLFCGALIALFIPEDFFLHFSLWQGRFLIFLLAIPMYICASASTPIAVAMVLKGLAPGSALIFLLLGPATNITNLIILKRELGTKTIVLNLLAIILVAFFAAVIVDYFYTGYPLNFKLKTFHQHSQATWWQMVSSLIFGVLLVRVFLLKRFFRGKK